MNSKKPPTPAADDRQIDLFRGRDRWVRRWEVPSTTGDATYIVAVDAAGNWGCSCGAWVHDSKRRPCKHIADKMSLV